MSWFSKAACKGADINMFFPKRGEVISDTVRQICAVCPVQQECLDYALSQDFQIGVYGGLSGRQRDTIIYKYDRRAHRKAG